MKIRKSWIEALAALGVAFLVIQVLDRFTNNLNMQGHIWDFVYYIDIAEKGLIGNDHLGAPYAYRFLTPLLAQLIIHITGHSTFFAFKSLAYLGLWITLFTVYLIARHFKTNFKTGLLVMLVPACALFNVKFLMFDPYRPDQLAYPMLAMGYLAILVNQPGLALIASLIGLQTREFPIIPVLILLVEAYRSWRQGKPLRSLIPWVVVVILSVGLAFGLPRALIKVKFTQQILDPFNDPNFLNVLLHMPLDWKRDLNYLFNLVAYALPILMLATPERLKAAWRQLGRMKVWVILHIIVVMIFMLYGGTDMMRYATYFFIPQALMMVFILRDGKVHPLEIIVMYIALIIFNRLLVHFPIDDFSAYLNFYGGYGDWINPSSLARALELVGFIGLGMITRLGLKLFEKRKSSTPVFPV
jgi:hypothetical protein